MDWIFGLAAILSDKGLIVMTFIKRLSVLAVSASLCFSCGCSAKEDAGVLFREAKSNAEQLQSCDATFNSTLTFTANGVAHTFQSSEESVYQSKPFALKAVQTYQNGNARGSSESYTVTENGGLWFYCKSSSGWQKTGAQNLNTSPFSQIDILSLLNNVKNEKYVRETAIGSHKLHKIELELSNEAIRNTIENIVTVTGMAENSQTIVQTLLNGSPALYGYCYVGADSGEPERLELDATDALNQIFQNIDGSNIKISVTKFAISGNITKINQAPSVILPEEAKKAQSIQAYG